MINSNFIEKMLPFIFQINGQRKEYPLSSLFINSIQVVFCLLFFLAEIENQIDPNLSTLLESVKSDLLQNYYLLSISTYASITYTFLLIFTYVYLKSTDHQGTWKSGDSKEIIRRFCLLYGILEIFVVPSFLIILYNIKNYLQPSLIFLNIIAFPFLIGLIIAEKNSRIFKQYFILIGIFSVFLDKQYSLLMLCVISAQLARTEKSLTKKIVYLQFIWFGLTLLIAIIAEVKLNFYYIGTVCLQIVVVCLLFPQQDQRLTCIQENDILLQYIENLDFSTGSKNTKNFNISKIINKFAHSLKKNKQDTTLGMQFLVNEELRNKKYLLNFLTFKINQEKKEDNANIVLEIQQIQCCLLAQSFSIELIEQILKLNMKIKQQNAFTYQIRIYESIQKVQTKYLKNHGANAKALIQIEGQLQKFYEGILQITKIIMKFWTLKRKNKLDVLQMKNHINNIIILEIKLKENLKKIQQFRPAKIQTLIYNYLMKLINNSNQISASYNSHYEGKHQANLNYILIQKQQIVDISNQMAIQIHMDKKDIIGINLNSIFPSQLKHFVASYSNCLIQAQKARIIILPFLINRSNQFMQPHLCRFQLFHDFINGIKYVLHFYNSDHLQANPTFLYNPQQDKISCVSSNFLSYFGIEYKGTSKLQFFGSELFNFAINEIFVQNQQISENQNQWINCTLRPKTILNMNHEKHISAEIKCIQRYTIQTGLLILLEIRKKQFYPSISNKKFKDNMSQFLIKESKKCIAQHKNISFIGVNFCKIANPHQNVIDQKMSRIQQLNKLSYLKLTLIVILLNAILFAIILTLIRVKIDISMNDIQHKYNKNNYNGNKAFNIISIMYKYFNYYQLINYPINYESINININISSLRSMYSAQIEQALQDQTINVIETNKLNNEAAYELSFSDFSTILSTQSTGLIDFLQIIKLAMKSNDPQFLIVNSDALGVIINNIPLINQNIMNNLIVLLNQLIIAQAVIVFINFLILRFILYKIRQINIRLIDIYTKIDHQQVGKVYQKLKSFANVMQTSHKYTSQNKTWNDSLNKIEEIDFYRPKIRSRILKQTTKFDATINKSYQKQETKILNRLNQATPQKFEVKNIIHRYSGNFILDNITIVISLIILSFLLLVIHQANQCKKQFHNIFETQLNFHQTINSIETSAYKFYNTGMMSILPSQKRRSWQINQYKILKTQIDQSLPQFYQEFKIIQTRILNQELCIFIQNIETQYEQQFNCSEILGGVLTKGFESSANIYYALIDNFGQVFMPDYRTTYRIGAKYPVFFQVSFLEEVLTSVLAQLQLQFNDTTTKYIQQWRIYLILLPQLGILLILIIIGVSSLHYMNIRQQCKFGLKIFILIPRSYLLKMSTTKMLKKSKIMDDIQWLAF